MRRHLASLTAGLLVFSAAACNPNFEFGDAREKPADWSAPPSSSSSGGEGHGGSGGSAGSLDEIEKRLKEKIAADAKDVDSRKQLGQLYAEMGRWDESVKILDEAIVIAPKDVDARLTKVAVLLQRRDQGAAKLELENLSKLAPDDEGVLRGWRQYWLATEDVEQAVKAGQRLLAKHPDVADAENIELWNFYLTRLPKLGGKEGTKKFFDLIAAASRAQDRGNHAEAIARYTEAKAMLPDDPHLLASLATSQWATGAQSEALATWNAALAIDPSSSKARLGLARAQAEGGDARGAVSTLKDWIKKDPKRAKRHDAAAIVARLEKGEPFDGGAGASGKAIAGTIEIAPSVASKVPAGATLYVMAKQQASDRIPIAVLRAQAGSFPMKFQLDESNVMQQGMPFDGEFVLLARIDGDGSAGAQPGDLEGLTAKAVKVGTRDVKIVIDTVVGGGGASASVATPPPASAGSGGAISGKISLAPELASKVPASATLYVFAKMQPGGGPPIAVKRGPVGAFPAEFSLTKDDVMQPGMPFDGPLYLTARIDLDGVAGAGPGDMEGTTPSAVPIGTSGVEIRIDKVR